MRRLRARPDLPVLSVVMHTVTAVPTHAGVTRLLADVLAGLPNVTVTVAEAGTVIARLSDGSAFFVRTAR